MAPSGSPDGIAGTVIYLNGTSSSGKSTLASELQRLLEHPYAVLSVDAFLRMWGTRAPRRNGSSAARAARVGFHGCIAALASAGNNVIVDSILLTDEHKLEAAGLLHPFRAYLVGVYCPLEIAEERERARGDRRAGLARSQLPDVHAHGVYDLEVDTSVMTPVDCARHIQTHVEHGPAPSAFSSLLRTA